jgi:hypothetical protein
LQLQSAISVSISQMSKHSDVNTEASKIIRTSDHDILLYLISIKRSLQSLVARFGLVPGTLDGRFPQGFINAAKKRAIAAKYLGRPVTKETDSDATKIYDEVTEMRKGVGALPGCLNGDIDNLENPALKHHSAYSDGMHARGKLASMLVASALAYLDAAIKKAFDKLTNAEEGMMRCCDEYLRAVELAGNSDYSSKIRSSDALVLRKFVRLSRYFYMSPFVVHSRPYVLATISATISFGLAYKASFGNGAPVKIDAHYWGLYFWNYIHLGFFHARVIGPSQLNAEQWEFKLKTPKDVIHSRSAMKWRYILMELHRADVARAAFDALNPSKTHTTERSVISARVTELELDPEKRGDVELLHHPKSEVQTQLFVLGLLVAAPDYIRAAAAQAGDGVDNEADGGEQIESWFENDAQGGVTFVCDPARTTGARLFSVLWDDVTSMLLCRISWLTQSSC